MRTVREKNPRPSSPAKGTWWHRFVIRLLTLVLTVLLYWLLGFFVEDIRSLPGPDYGGIEEQHVDAALVEKRQGLEEQIAELDLSLKNQADKQQLLGDGSRSLQQTMTQLLELQKLGIEKNVEISEANESNLDSTLELFLANQRSYQELSESRSRQLIQRQELQEELTTTKNEIRAQQVPAREDYEAQWERHRLWLAFWQLLILLPILTFAGFLLVKRRESIYFPLYLSLALATLFKVGLVIHEYFPTRYFKYILIGSLLIVVGRLLIHFIASSAHPKAEWLLKQYRESYERFLCPVCEYPIRIGPRRYLFWTRRTVAKLPVPSLTQSAEEEAYTCPSCGSGLYSECPSCHKIRHSLLPHCQHCGEVSDDEDLTKQ